MPCFFYLLNGLFYPHITFLSNFADEFNTICIGKYPFERRNIVDKKVGIKIQLLYL